MMPSTSPAFTAAANLSSRALIFASSSEASAEDAVAAARSKAVAAWVTGFIGPPFSGAGGVELQSGGAAPQQSSFNRCARYFLLGAGGAEVGCRELGEDRPAATLGPARDRPDLAPASAGRRRVRRQRAARARRPRHDRGAARAR